LNALTQGQCSPSTPRFDDRITLSQPELPTDEIHFRDLRLLECHVGVFEIRARVQELLVEPRLIEIVTEVIVVMNVLTRSLEAVCALHMQADLLTPRWHQAQSGDCFEHPLQFATDLERSRHVHFAELQMRIEQDATERPCVVHNKGADCGL